MLINPLSVHSGNFSWNQGLINFIVVVDFVSVCFLCEFTCREIVPVIFFSFFLETSNLGLDWFSLLLIFGFPFYLLPILREMTFLRRLSRFKSGCISQCGNFMIFISQNLREIHFGDCRIGKMCHFNTFRGSEYWVL